jgi:hypothetical protein
MRPIAACAMGVVERTRVSQVTPESPGTPHAMVLTASFVLSPVTGLSCHRHQRELLPANLTPASGRQDHTTSPSASRIARQALRPRPPHPAPRFVTLRNAPLWDGMARIIKLIWVFGKSEYFCKKGWTEWSVNGPSDLPVGSACRDENNKRDPNRSFRDGPKDQTSDAQSRIGESRDSQVRNCAVRAIARPGMTAVANPGFLKNPPPRASRRGFRSRASDDSRALSDRRR